MKRAKPGTLIEGTDNPRKLAQAFADALDELMTGLGDQELCVMLLISEEQLGRVIWHIYGMSSVGVDDPIPSDEDIEHLIEWLDAFSPDDHEFRERSPDSHDWGYFPLRAF